jgi:hypothetical protein
MNSNRALIPVHNLHRSRALAALGLQLSDTERSGGNVLRKFGTWRAMVLVRAVLGAALLSSPLLQAAVVPTFTAGTVSVGPGGTVDVPIIVSGFTSPDGSGGLQSVQFNLQWNSGVLQYVGTGNYNPTLTAYDPVTKQYVGLGATCFDSPSAGLLSFLFYDHTGNGQTLADGSTMFTVQFTATGGIGASTHIDFVDTINIPREVTDYNYNSIAFSMLSGQVSVVPEPINWALGMFACVFIGGAGVRWVSSRRAALVSTDTASISKQAA